MGDKAEKDLEVPGRVARPQRIGLAITLREIACVNRFDAFVRQRFARCIP